MESGYSILWTDNALEELEATIQYLSTRFTEKEIQFLAHEIERISFLIAHNPLLFPPSQMQKGVRKVVVAKFNTLYYRINQNTIEILSFFSNRQGPGKLQL
jgi:plasmid stabilization system protein ParE